MKKLWFIAFMLVVVNQLFAQCTINQSNTTDGFTPAVLSCINAGSSYSEGTQLHIPASVTVSGITLPVDSVMLLSISGMPVGISYGANPAVGQMLYPGDNGCVQFSGFTNDTSGTYALVVMVRVWVQAPFPGLSPADVDLAQFGYGVTLSVCGGPTSCVEDTLYNVQPTDSFITYTFAAPNSGYISGNNSYGDLAKAEKFGATPGDKVYGAQIVFSVGTTQNPNRLINISVYDDGGVGGSPGTLLASENVSLGTIMSYAGSFIPLPVNFSAQPTLASDSFFIVVNLPTDAGDTLALLTNTGATPFGRGWEQWIDGTWHTYIEAYTDPIGNVIFPIICTTPTAAGPVAAFTANNLAGCAPLTVQFTNLSTNNPTSWSWTFTGGNPSTSTAQNPTVTFNNSGSYNVTLTATNASGSDGESKTSYITVYSRPTVTIANTTSASCTQGGSVTTSVIGGSGFTYLWSNNATTANLTNVSAGTYSVTVTNNNNCTATASAIVTSSGSSVFVSLNKVNSTCGLSNGSISSTPSGGSGYTYQWSNGATTQNLSGLGAGTYTLTVIATGGCSASASTVIPASSGVSVTLTKTDPSCGLSNGGITSNVSGGSGYTYSWNTGATTQNLTGLGAGTYTLTVTATGGCSASASSVISGSSGITLTLTKTDAACAQANGSITSNVTGGSGYTYHWSNNATTANLSNIAAGTYMLTVTATGGCTASASATVNTSSGNLSANATVGTTPNCGQSNGSASVTVSGGTTPYSYTWSTNPTQTTPTAFSVAAGSYTVTVTDNAGCTTTAAVNVSNVGGPNALIQSTTNVSCYNGNDGSVSLTATGGSAPYSYSTNGVNYQSPSTFNGLTAGTYTFYVRDNSNCVSTTGATITQPTPLAVTFTKTDVACFGGNTGNATANVTGGTPNYTYTWSNSQSGVIATNLTATSYSLVVEDTKGCTVASSVAISQPAAALSAPITVSDVACFGGNDGDATVNASGGTTPYSYQWSNGQNGISISSLSSGPVGITVTDTKGCTVTTSETVSQPASALSATTTPENVSCIGDNDGSITTAVSGGTSPYSFAWSNSSTLQNPVGLDAGSYVVTITDAHACTGTSSAIIAEPGIITLGAVIQDATSSTAHDGVATVNATGGTPPYTYFWNNSVTTASNSGVMTGNYAVTVTDANGCVATSQMFVGALVGISGTSLNGEVRLFPNPTEGLLLLDIDLNVQHDVKIEVVNVMGAVVDAQTFKQVSQRLLQLDLSAHANGVYFVRIETANGELMRKVIVAK